MRVYLCVCFSPGVMVSTQFSKKIEIGLIQTKFESDFLRTLPIDDTHYLLSGNIQKFLEGSL